MRLIIEDVKHLKLKENLLWLGTSTLVTILFWIAYTIYLAYTRTQIDPEVQSLLKPLNPSLDQQAIQLVTDQFVPPDQSAPVVVTPTPIQLGLTPQTPVGTSSPTLSP